MGNSTRGDCAVEIKSIKAITMKLSENIEKNIQGHRESLETYDHYRDTLRGCKDDKIADLIENCDWESEDFNVGFEQGFLAGMKSVLREVKASETV